MSQLDNSMKFSDELTLLLKARYPIIYINTVEEDRVEYVKNQVVQIIKGINIKFVIKNKDNIKNDISFNYDFQKQDIEKIINYGWTKDDNNYSMVIE